MANEGTEPSRAETLKSVKGRYQAGTARSYPPRVPDRAVERLAALVEGEPPRPQAVFVAHGMGQQIPFQTLDAIAIGLQQADGRRRQQQKQPPASTRPVVRTVTLGEERLQRIELNLLTNTGPREVHIYEAYWAPFTEGQVGLRDVMRFLVTAGFHGIINGTRPFRRWLFGDLHAFPAPIRTVIFMLVALGAVSALTVMNATILLVGAARSPLKDPPHWLGPGVFGDLSTTLNIWLAVVVVFSVFVLAASWLRRHRASPLSWLLWRLVGALSVLSFVLALFATVAAGVAMPLFFFLHTRGGGTVDTTEFWAVLLGPGTVYGFDLVVGGALVGLILLTVLAGLCVFAGKFIWAWRHEMASAEVLGGKAFSSLVLWLFAVFVAGIVIEVALFAFASRSLDAESYSWPTLLRGVAWPLLLCVSILVRHLMVEYVGDVAAYVQSHTVDRFYDLRERIKESVRKKARAVYAARQAHGGFLYDSVAIVGHSLGSVIVYDVLNRLLNDDELGVGQNAQGGGAVAEVLLVKARTRVLLTFGSPLDKFAFVFGLQGRETSEAREALAASVQPLIREESFRVFPWINIFSRWDLFSGHLEFYDRPDRANQQPVDNQVDRDATTLFLAHTEYWGNPVLFDRLLASI